MVPEASNRGGKLSGDEGGKKIGELELKERVSRPTWKGLILARSQGG